MQRELADEPRTLVTRAVQPATFESRRDSADLVTARALRRDTRKNTNRTRVTAGPRWFSGARAIVMRVAAELG